MDENLPWGLGRWAAVIAAAAVTIVLTFLVDGFIGFFHSGTCGDAASPEQISGGRLGFAVVFGLTAAVWGATAVASERRGRMALVAVAAAIPSAVFLIDGLTDSAWVGSFCVF